MLVVLAFECDDWFEKAWEKPRRTQILEAIQDVRPDLTIAWGFSVWHRHADLWVSRRIEQLDIDRKAAIETRCHVDGWVYPRIEQLYNIKRSLLTYQSLQRLEIPAVPHIYWGDSSDIERWGRWLVHNPCVGTIAIDLQTADSDEGWETALRGLAQLRGVLDREVHLLLNGPCRPWRIRQVLDIWPDASFSNFAAYFSAVYTRKPMYELRARWTEEHFVSEQVVFERAINEYNELITNPERSGWLMTARDGRDEPDWERPSWRPSASRSMEINGKEKVTQLTLPCPDMATAGTTKELSCDT